MHRDHPAYRLTRAVLVVGGIGAYLAFVFRLDDGQARSMGLGDWIDPYFINGLLEHWFHVARTIAHPASPPVFHPAPHTLGYSHGLVLFSPFYVAARAWLHPFHAYTAAIVAVMAVGVACLYVLLRRLGCSFVESVALCALFFTSPNVVNGPTGVWTQRVSVFLIPPILLLALQSRSWPGWRRGTAAFAAGLLATLMYVQDFYTAHFAVLIAAGFAGALAVDRRATIGGTIRAVLHARPRSERVVLAVAAVALAAALAIFVTGGGGTRVFGVRLVARDWQRPALVGILAVSFLAYRNPLIRSSLRGALSGPWIRAFVAGAACGAAVFLWIYLPAFRAHPGFPDSEVWRALSDDNRYLSWRSFVFVAVLAALTWTPWFRASRTPRLYAACLVAGSIAVWLVPVRFGDYALWMDVIRRFPGFGAIRDPGRIVYVYELAVAIAAAAILRHVPDRVYRAAIATAAVVLVCATPNRERFDYGRPIALYDRWVGAPIEIDPACRSFFIKGASEHYTARSPANLPALYGTDASFIALRYSLPTLNGYSAWSPEQWDLANPQDASYGLRVNRWIGRHALTNVCELDIDARRMRVP